MKTPTHLLFVAAAILLCPRLSSAENASPLTPSPEAPDSTLFTTYSLDTARTTLSYVVCGSTQFTSGCYAAGVIGPFGKMGALLEGDPKIDVSANTVTRAIYVVDIAQGENRDGVVLYVYTKTDTISPDYDEVSVTLSETVALPLLGGSRTIASMAANRRFLFIGTSKSREAVELSKRRLSIVDRLGGFSAPINVSSITADQAGYVTLSFGTSRGESGSIVVGPDGRPVQFGGGEQFMLNTVQAVQPSMLH